MTLNRIERAVSVKRKTIRLIILLLITNSDTHAPHASELYHAVYLGIPGYQYYITIIKYYNYLFVRRSVGSYADSGPFATDFDFSALPHVSYDRRVRVCR